MRELKRYWQTIFCRSLITILKKTHNLPLWFTNLGLFRGSQLGVYIIFLVPVGHFLNFKIGLNSILVHINLVSHCLMLAREYQTRLMWTCWRFQIMITPRNGLHRVEVSFHQVISSFYIKWLNKHRVYKVHSKVLISKLYTIFKI